MTLQKKKCKKDWFTRLSHYPKNIEISKPLTQRTQFFFVHRMHIFHVLLPFATSVAGLYIPISKRINIKCKMYIRCPINWKYYMHFSDRPLAAFSLHFTSFLKVNDTHCRYVLKPMCVLNSHQDKH